MSEPDPILPPSEQEFRQRVRDLESWVQQVSQMQRTQAVLVMRLRAENARLRRAMRTLAKLQPEARVRRAMMEVMNDAR
jgi:hypothetical protein